MSLPAGIYWHQGMFLQPQHFQLAELHQQFQRTPLMGAMQPHFWGLGALELSAAAIANRAIEIVSGKFLFADGSYIEYPGNAIISPRSFKAAWVEGDRPFMVYLGLRRLSWQDQNVTVVHPGVDGEAPNMQVPTRFVSPPGAEEVADLYAAGPAAQVRSLFYVLRIYFEDELDGLSDYNLIPIACLVRDGDAIKMSPGFVPPCYVLEGSDALVQQVKDIRDEMAARARQLNEYKSPREMQKSEFDSSYMVFLLALRSLNRICPYLQHLVESRHIHPWTVYGALRQLVGELSSFSENVNMFGETEDGPYGLPPYQHNDLGNCFARAHTLISHLLSEITVGPEFLATLKPDGDGYAVDLPKSFFGPRTRFYLVVRSEAGADAVVEPLLRNARLAAATEMPKLTALALPGVELIHMPSAPQGLPRRAHSHYFRIEQASQPWEAIEREGRIALWWLDAPVDMVADIVVVRR